MAATGYREMSQEVVQTSRNRSLWVLLGALIVVGAALVVTTKIPWQASLPHDGASYGSLYEPRALWNKPEPPSYESFAAQFESLPAAPPVTESITIGINWNHLSYWLFGVPWIALLITGSVKVLTRRRHREDDALLSYSLAASGGARAGGALCVMTWLCVGGLVPPIPWSFVLVGGVVGVRFTHTRRKRTEKLEESS